MNKREQFREKVRKVSDLSSLILRTDSSIESLNCKNLLYEIRVSGKDAYDASHSAYITDYEIVEKIRAYTVELLSEKLVKLEKEMDEIL